MKRALAVSLLLVCAAGANAAEVVQAARWELHNSFWMSLHQTLIADASAKTPRELHELTAEEQTAWNEAVAAYRAAVTGGDFSFARPMVRATDLLTQVADDATHLGVEMLLAEPLKKAAPVYRKHWWAADQKANQFFIDYAAAMLRDAGEELAAAHSAVYRTPLPERIRLYATPHGGRFGAYTLTQLPVSGTVITMSSRDATYQGLHALEMVLHESSHELADPIRGKVAEAINASVKKHAIPNPDNLWHAILFATSSELTRRALAVRGTAYTGHAQRLLTDIWPRYREPIAKHWMPYLDGKGTLEEAIEKIILDLKP